MMLIEKNCSINDGKNVLDSMPLIKEDINYILNTPDVNTNSFKGRAVITEIFNEAFKIRKWSKSASDCKVSDGKFSRIMDFYHKDARVGVELELKKNYVLEHDLIKFQYFYNNNFIKLGIWILPVGELRSPTSKGITYEKVEKDFPVLKKLLGEKLTVPVVLFGFNIKNGEH